MKKQHFRNKNNNSKYFVGRQIRASRVLCIDQNNTNCGVISLSDALDLANKNGLDLVQISNGSKDKMPTCKILDYSKFKYDLSKKEKLAKKKQRESAVKIKEIKFRPSTGENDLRIKAKQASAFLEDGHRVKVTIVFRGREMSHRQIGEDTLQQFVDMLSNVEFESKPSMNGRNMVAILAKKTKTIIRNVS